MSRIQPNADETARRDAVMGAILEHVAENRTIRLPDFDPAQSRPSDTFALVSVGIEKNDFGGTVSKYRYQFEGEEDLLHLIVTRTDGTPLRPEEGQAVVSFLLPTLPQALIWLKPGELSQHFYCGHDHLLEWAPES
jgi:hypothetical protein